MSSGASAVLDEAAEGDCGGETDRRSLQPAGNIDDATMTQTVSSTLIFAAIQLGREVGRLMRVPLRGIKIA